MKTQKGITLIALIITIIVMLILVGVTVNVALNGGIFEKAKAAAAQTEEETLYEELITSTEYTANGEIDVESTYNAFKEGKTVTEKTTENSDHITRTIVFEVEGKTGTYAYSITTNKVMKGAIPWVTNGLTDRCVNYDKNYTFDYVIGDDTYKLFVCLRSNGNIFQYNNPFQEAAEMTMEQLEQFGMTYNSDSAIISAINLTYTFDTDDSLVISGPGVYENKFIAK
ncbi:MAG: hypothetical protein J5507_03645 [Clostridia bacterium]|nr:hypothetical protein [Clostridia bacterium]